MQLEKFSSQKDETINMYEELFSKKPLENESKESDSQESDKIKKIEENSLKNEVNDENIEQLPTSILKKIQNKIKINAKNMNVKYLVIGLLLGIITNMSVYHYQSTALNYNSQKLATGLLYNLSENNDLQQIASNIYLGMKENGWEPTIKMSNANAFIFELDKGGEFTITKSTDMISTRFRVSVDNFSQEMLSALQIQLEPHKIGGTKNYISNKVYNSKAGTISFDIEKINYSNLDALYPPLNSPKINLELPALPSLPPLNQLPQLLNPPLVDSKIINIPISKELDNTIMKINNENKIK